MVAVLQELIIGTSPVNTSTNYSVTTNLVATDVVVVVCSRGSGTPSTTISGLGATWTQIFNASANTRAQAHWTTGRTGTGTIAVNVNSTIEASRTVIYVIRGLNSSTLNGLQMSVWDNATGPDETPAQLFGQDQFAIGVAISSNPGTATFPTGSPPAAGWTVDDVFTGGANLFTAHAVGGTGETSNITIGINNGGNFSGATLIIFGRKTNQPAAPVPGSPVIVEKRYMKIPTTGAFPVGMDTLLDPTDVLVIAFNQNPAQTISRPSVTGSSAEVYRIFSNQQLNAYATAGFFLTSMTGSPTITLNIGNSGGDAFFYVIRGLNSATVELATRTTWNSTGSVSKSTDLVAAKAGQVAIMIGQKEGPGTGSLGPHQPGAGWAIDYGGSTMWYSSRVITETSTPLQGTIQQTLSGPLGLWMLLFGAPNVHESDDISIVHRATLAIPNGSQTVTVPLGFSVLATDYVLFIMQKGQTGSTFRLQGWNERICVEEVLNTGAVKPVFSFDSSSFNDIQVLARRGLTGTSDITMDITTTSQGGSAVVMVIRGLNEWAPKTISQTAAWGTPSTADLSTSAHPIVDGTLAVGFGWWQVAATQFDAASPVPTPASGWTEELFKTAAEANAAFRFRVRSLEATATGTAQLTMDNTGTAATYGALLMTFPDPAAPPPPVGPLHNSWGSVGI